MPDIYYVFSLVWAFTCVCKNISILDLNPVYFPLQNPELSCHVGKNLFVSH